MHTQNGAKLGGFCVGFTRDEKAARKVPPRVSGLFRISQREGKRGLFA